MNLEDRLRAELDRSGRSTNVGAAPSVDDLASVASGRQQRNRMMGAGGAMLTVGAIAIGAFAYTQQGSSTVEVASAGDDVAEVVESEAVPAESDPVPTANDEPITESDDALPEVVADSAATETAPADGAAAAVETEATEAVRERASAAEVEVAEDEVDLVAAFGAAQLQVDDTAMTVETQESAVGLASGSGVLLVPADGGYVGLAVAFGNDTTAIGISSNNGLDWSSSVLTGVPAGATASALRQHNGTYVALFERFNADTGLRQTFVGTSADAVAWDAVALQGEVYATDLAVGANGVLVVGDNDDPSVWSGPIGGPYARSARLDTLMVNGVTAVDGEFVVAGRTGDGLALFTSTDGAEWTTVGLGTNAQGMTVSVSNGTVTLRSVDGGTADTLISSDAGQTWSALPAAANRGVSASQSTLGFLGDSPGAVVAMADADSFSTAELDVAAPDRLALVATGTNELVMVQTTETGTTWIVVSR